MNILDGIRATGTQTIKTAAENGDQIEITLYYRPAIQWWTMDISCNSFELNGYRIYNSLNMLDQFKNIIPFGLACLVSDGGEPFLINDFSTARCQLCVLTPSEIAEIDAYYQELKEE